MSTAAAIEAEARRLGFSLFGIAPAADADHFDFYSDWLDRGYAGEMAYLHDHHQERRHPGSVLADVRSVIMLGMEYAEPGAMNVANDPALSFHPHPRSEYGKVARYAQGPDYHRYIWERLNVLGSWIQAAVPGSHTRGVTDSAPLLERDFARRAGLGWVGKNTMLINKHRGSFFFLAGLLTSLELPASEPHTASHCGTCTACLDACPTDAFPEPGMLDARKCISYLTIELRGPIPENLRDSVGSWLFGCDICQEVCPWNRDQSRQKPRSLVEDSQPGLPHNPELAALDAVELLALTEAQFRQRFRGTPMMRTKRTSLLRNAAIVLGNVGDEKALDALRLAAADEDGIIREAAVWAIERIESRLKK